MNNSSPLPIRRRGPSLSEVRGILLVLLGLASLAYYFRWWFEAGRLASPWLWIGLLAALCYSAAQICGSWLIYLATHHRRRQLPTAVKELTVDVFVTAYGEPYEMVRDTLDAACAMQGAHRTWLLDDSENPEFAKLAARLGAGYLTRSDRTHAKAGNINAALKRTDGDILVIFDIDHKPAPNFLSATLGYFADPKIGFVQVMLTFANGREGWVPQAADESSQDFYHCISTGADALESSTLVGTNALIRRSALESIGGYQPGLAEDLETSIALHAAGWQSLYVPDPLAPGLAPPDLPAWFTQQFKWARGVFETLLVAYPRYFTRLTLRQRLVYAVRMTYYWFGLVIFLHLAAVIYVLLSADRALLAALESYLQHLLPLMLLVLLIRLLALRRWRHNTVPRNAQWRPIILVYATWPIYTVAWWMALLRLPLRFRLTPKTPAGHLHPNWILGQMVAMFLLIAGLTYHLITLRGQFYPLTVAFVCAQIVPHWLFFWFFRTTKLHDRRTEPLPSVLPARTSWHDKPVETDS